MAKKQSGWPKNSRGAAPGGSHPGEMGRIPTLGAILVVHIKAQIPRDGTSRSEGGTQAFWCGAGAEGVVQRVPLSRHIVGSASGVSFLRKCSPWSRNNQSGDGNKQGWIRPRGRRAPGGWRRH